MIVFVIWTYALPLAGGTAFLTPPAEGCQPFLFRHPPLGNVRAMQPPRRHEYQGRQELTILSPRAARKAAAGVGNGGNTGSELRIWRGTSASRIARLPGAGGKRREIGGACAGLDHSGGKTTETQRRRDRGTWGGLAARAAKTQGHRGKPGAGGGTGGGTHAPPGPALPLRVLLAGQL